jgi:hypothetical protein
MPSPHCSNRSTRPPASPPARAFACRTSTSTCPLDSAGYHSHRVELVHAHGDHASGAVIARAGRRQQHDPLPLENWTVTAVQWNLPNYNPDPSGMPT